MDGGIDDGTNGGDAEPGPGPTTDSPIQATFALGALDDHQRAELIGLLDHYEVDHLVVGSLVRVDAAEEELVEGLVAWVRTPVDERPPPPPPEGHLGTAPPTGLEAAVAAPGWRLLAYLVEAALLLVTGLTARALLPDGARTIPNTVLVVASGIVLVAVTGRTVGMWVCRLRIVVPPSSAPPGWGTAVVRFAVATWPVLPLEVAQRAGWTQAVRWLDLVQMVWWIACFGPILTDDLRRGLHDRVAHTLVVRDDRLGALEP